ncbi:MAG: phosphatidylserine decarboxylase, partial [Burkholderiaceae bacterium]
RNAVILERVDGRRITCVQVAGLIARRILCYVKANDHVARGSRFGFIRFGSRVDIYLPTDAQPLVTVGEKVSASRSVIASLTVVGKS